MTVQSRALRDGFTPSTTFDPTGALDGLVIERVEGVAIFAEPAPEPPAFDPYTLVDPSIPASAEPSEPADDDDEPSTADHLWWAVSTRAHRPDSVPLDVYRVMCEAAGLGAVGFCEGFEPDAGDWPTLVDVPLPTWDDGPLLAEV